MEKHIEFLLAVQSYVQSNPEVGAYISDFVSKGIDKSRNDALERAADMEIALIIALSKRFKEQDSIILDKINKWKDKSAVKWDSTIEHLNKKAQ